MLCCPWITLAPVFSSSPFLLKFSLLVVSTRTCGISTSWSVCFVQNSRNLLKFRSFHATIAIWLLGITACRMGNFKVLMELHAEEIISLFSLITSIGSLAKKVRSKNEDSILMKNEIYDERSWVGKRSMYFSNTAWNQSRLFIPGATHILVR